jgi:hypothetical protein
MKVLRLCLSAPWVVMVAVGEGMHLHHLGTCWNCKNLKSHSRLPESESVFNSIPT